MISTRKILIGAVLAVFAALPPAGAAQAPAAAEAALVPPLAPVARTLPNGARVYTLRDPSSAVVSVHAFYQVGQRDDPQGRGGFAHLFEHLMFRTTRNLPDGVSAFINSIGGQTNASTLFDHTPYYVQAPANQLEALIWLEGERLRNLVIDEPSFAAERDVVKEEIRQRVLASPYGRILYTLLPGYTFRDHPYARPIGGTLDDLDAATLSDVRAFHEAYYRPDNVIFVISGNFEQAELDSWVDRYIGSIPRPAAPILRDESREAAPLEARTVDAFAPNVPLPALIYSWRAPAAADPDSAALGLIDALLVRGASGRLRRSLVDGSGIASNVSSFNIGARDGHAFALVVTLAEGRELQQAAVALDAELVRLRETLASDAELNAVKNALLGEALQRRETPRGRAFELGDALALTGDPGLPDRRLRAMLALTPQDVRAAARRLLDPARRVAIRYRNESARTDSAAEEPLADVSDMGPVVPPASRPPIAIAAQGERVQPPAAGPDVPRAVPPLAERRLANGMRVIVARSTDLPLVTMRMLVEGGDAVDPAGKAGRGDLLAATLLRGAGERDANAMAAAIDSLGASINAVSDADATSLTVTAPRANADAAGRLLADIALRPMLPDAELARVRSQQANALTVARRQPMASALRALTATLYEGSPYGALPTAATLEAVARSDLAAAHGAWQPEQATLIVTGALTPDEGFALAERLFGNWQGDGRAEAAAVGSPGEARPRLVVVDMPGAAQAAVIAGLRGPPRNDASFSALRVASARLGGGFLGFLNQEIRVRRGLSYGAGSQLDPRGDSTTLFAASQTRNDAAAEVVALIRAQMRRVVEEPASADEAAERSTYVGNALAAQSERTEGLAAYLASLVATDTPLAVARAELAGAPALSPEAIQAAAAATIRPDALTIVVAGDSRLWIDALRSEFPDLRLVTFDGEPVQ